MTTKSHPRVGWEFWIKWVIATTASPVLASIISTTVASILYAVLPFLGLLIGLALSGSSIGILLGITQASILKSKCIDSSPWILASAVGWITGAIIATLFARIFSRLDVDVFRIFIGIGIGLSLGIGQWLILRQQFRQAFWWIPANVIGWTIFMTNLDVGLVLPIFPVTSSMDSLVVGGLIVGAVTGFTMIWLLRHPIQQLDQSTSSMTSV